MSQVAGDAEHEVPVAGQDQHKAEVDEAIPKRLSIEKLPILTDSDFNDDLDDDLQPTALDQLPEEIIQQ